MEWIIIFYRNEWYRKQEHQLFHTNCLIDFDWRYRKISFIIGDKSFQAPYTKTHTRNSIEFYYLRTFSSKKQNWLQNHFQSLVNSININKIWWRFNKCMRKVQMLYINIECVSISSPQFILFYYTRTDFIIKYSLNRFEATFELCVCFVYSNQNALKTLNFS